MFFFVPVIAAFGASMTDFDLYALADIRNLRFVGFANYQRLLHLPEFWDALGHTLYFVIVGVPLSIFASLAAAPFVRFFGMNGFLVLHALMLFVCGLAMSLWPYSS